MRMKLGNSPYGAQHSPLLGLFAGVDWGDDDLVFDWSSVGFVSMGQLVALAQAARSHMNSGGTFSDVLPDSTTDVCDYAARMSYFDAVGTPYEYGKSRHPASCRFMEIREVKADEDVSSATDDAVAVLFPHVPMDGNVQSAMNYAFAEIADNIITHSRSRTGGLVGLQWSPGSGYVEVGVADGGDGIVETMRNNSCYTDMEAGAVMLSALEMGVGECVDMENVTNEHLGGGVGLATAVAVVKALKSSMTVVSRSAAVEITSDETRLVDGLSFPGTAIAMRLPTTAERTITKDDIFGDGDESAFIWSAKEGFAAPDEDDGFSLW